MNLTIGYINRAIYQEDIEKPPASRMSAGIDMRANIPRTIVLDSPYSVKIPLGLGMEIPEGYAGLLVPRSGTGSRGFELVNTMGVIDADYRGEIIAVARNKLHGTGKPLTIEPGERIAQLIIVPVVTLAMFTGINHIGFDDLGKTERGAGGFGSTGSGV